MLPPRDSQGSKEGPKLTAQPHVGGGVGGRTVAGTFRVLRTQEQERSVRQLNGQYELTTLVRDPSANYSTPSYYPLMPAC
jgi:type VI protein secretion system component VasK